jgi:hypothetical protein
VKNPSLYSLNLFSIHFILVLYLGFPHGIRALKLTRVIRSFFFFFLLPHFIIPSFLFVSSTKKSHPKALFVSSTQKSHPKAPYHNSQIFRKLVTQISSPSRDRSNDTNRSPFDHRRASTCGPKSCIFCRFLTRRQNHHALDLHHPGTDQRKEHHQ